MDDESFMTELNNILLGLRVDWPPRVMSDCFPLLQSSSSWEKDSSTFVLDVCSLCTCCARRSVIPRSLSKLTPVCFSPLLVTRLRRTACGAVFLPSEFNGFALSPYATPFVGFGTQGVVGGKEGRAAARKVKSRHTFVRMEKYCLQQLQW